MTPTLALANSHLAQADSLKKRLESDLIRESVARSILWATYFAHRDAAERLIEIANEEITQCQQS